MAKGRLGEFDEKIRQRPEAKILVYFALILALIAIPYTCVVYFVRWETPSLHDSLLEAIGAASAVAAVFLMRNTPGALPVSDHGFRIRGIVSQTAIGAAIGLALMSAIMNALRASGNYIIDGRNANFSPMPLAILYLFVAIFEETIFRGYIFVVLEQKWGSFIALSTTSLVFGLAHLLDAVPGISFAHHLRAAIFIGFEAGILLNAAFILTRSLWLGIGIHWAWNFFEGPFFGTSVSGTNDQSYYIAHTKGSQLLTGGAFGPEAGIVCLIICTLAGLYMLRLAIRSGNWKINPELKIDGPPDAQSIEESVIH